MDIRVIRWRRVKALGWASVAMIQAQCVLWAQFGGGGGGAGGGATQGARQYFSNTMIGEALIEVDPETRSIIVVADDETNAQIQAVVQQVDQAKPQALIKVAFVEVTHRDEFDFGVDGSGSFDQSGDSQGTIESLFGLAAESQGGFYRILDSQYEVTLRAMAEEGIVEVLSKPSILARNNQQAIITIGQEVPFIRNTQITQNGQQINTVEYEDIGIILRVTPFITRNNLVEMIVEPEISGTTDETIEISAGIEAPVFSKRSAQTVAVTSHGQTVVIGGLMSSEKVKSVRKIPVLGDIPVLGFPFRRTVSEDVKTELLIFLTPYVIPFPDQLAEVTQIERDLATEMRKVFTDEQIGGSGAPPVWEKSQFSQSRPGDSRPASGTQSQGIRPYYPETQEPDAPEVDSRNVAPPTSGFSEEELRELLDRGARSGDREWPE